MRQRLNQPIGRHAPRTVTQLGFRQPKRGLIAEGEWVLAILAVHGEPPAITANLAGPLVIDMATATARQLVLEDPEFPLQLPVAELR